MNTSLNMTMNRFLTARNKRGKSDLEEELRGLLQERDEAIMIRNNIKSNLEENRSSLKDIRKTNEETRREILKLKLNYDEIHSRVLDN